MLGLNPREGEVVAPTSALGSVDGSRLAEGLGEIDGAHSSGRSTQTRDNTGILEGALLRRVGFPVSPSEDGTFEGLEDERIGNVDGNIETEGRLVSPKPVGLSDGSRDTLGDEVEGINDTEGARVSPSLVGLWEGSNVRLGTTDTDGF